MKKCLVVCLAVLILTACFAADAQEGLQAAVSFEEMDRQMKEAGGQASLQGIFEEIVSGNAHISLETLTEKILTLVKERIFRVGGFLTHAAWLMLVCALFSRLLPQSGKKSGAMTAIRLIAAVSVYEKLEMFLKDSERAIGAVSALIDTAAPILVSLLALAGGTHSGAFISPAGAFASGAVSSLLQKGGMALLRLLCALILARSAASLPLDRLTDALKSAVRWLIGSVMSLFLLFMSAGGAVAGAYDGAFQKGLKYAADHMIPIVGSDIAGRMDSIASNVFLLKSAAGVTGIIALADVCLRPAVDVFLAMWGLRALAAVLEPAADGKTVQLADDFSKVFSYLLSLIAASVCMGIVFIGAAIGIGRQMFG